MIIILNLENLLCRFIYDEKKKRNILSTIFIDLRFAVVLQQKSYNTEFLNILLIWYESY